jgi:two-component system phosphate regulon response regulator PhoB/two-component system alkaline phosphatase synthesis response regulator PhoP
MAGMIAEKMRSPMTYRIAVVEDEPDIAQLVSSHLQKEGFKVELFPDAGSFLKSLSKHRPDLILLDLMLPDADGLEICKLMKKKEEWQTIPVIILTAKGEETDKILGLELGADDYVTKPFSLKELTARIKAVLRRPTAEPASKKIEIGGELVIDLTKHQMSYQGNLIDLTSTEFKIVSLLASRKGWVFTRDQILDNLWGQDKIVLDRTIDVHIKNLREKLGDASRFVKNIRGVGYKLEE